MTNTLFLKNDFKSIFSELFLIFSILFILLSIIVLINIASVKEVNAANETILLALQICIITVIILYNNQFQNLIIFSNLLIINNFQNILKLLITIILIIKFLVTLYYFKLKQLIFFEYTLLVLLVIFGLFLLASAYDFVILYLAIEIVSLTSYVLSSLKRISLSSTEGSLKYFILGAFSSTFLLLGISFIYGFLGTTNFYEILQLNTFIYELYSVPTITILLGLILILTTLLFKLAAAPFHIWLPDVFEGSPLIVTFFFAILPKLVMLTVLIKLCFNIFFFFIDGWYLLLLVSGILSLILGTSMSLYQQNLKRFFAYSAISHMGFLLLGLVNLNVLGIFSVLFYNLIYILIGIGFFIILVSLFDLRTLKSKKYITELNGLVIFNSWLSISFVTLLFSIAGVPPLIGFFSKLYILNILIFTKNYLLALIIILFSVISTIYYIRLIKIIFFEKYFKWRFYAQLSFVNSILLNLILYNIIFFLYEPTYLLIQIDKFAFFSKCFLL